MTFERLKTPSHQFYLVTPTTGGTQRFVVILDNDGVPVWWHGEAAQPNDAKVLDDGTIAWFSNVAHAYVLYEADGTVVRTVAAPEGTTDTHDLQEEPNGDFLLISYQPREHVDLTEWGGGADDKVLDCVVEEVGPEGELVWRWSTEGHIGLAETGRWWPFALQGSPRDICHMNAVQPVGDDAILVSMRHLDAVYKIDKATGQIVWKLGGTFTPKSLTVLNDPEGAYPLGGQHDIRLQPDGTITIHDNNTGLPDPTRAVRYEIDEAAHTATLVESVEDPEAPNSGCCGSARRSADGSWLMSWGSDPLVTEFNAAGERTFRLNLPAGFSYRAVSAPDGAIDKPTLRAGMDSMFPR